MEAPSTHETRGEADRESGAGARGWTSALAGALAVALGAALALPGCGAFPQLDLNPLLRVEHTPDGATEVEALGPLLAFRSGPDGFSHALRPLYQHKANHGLGVTDWLAPFGRRFEVQDGVTESNHGVIDYLVVTSAEFWSNLPPDVRAQLDVILTQVTLERNEVAHLLAEENKQRVLDAGSVVRVLTPDQRATWVRALRPVWEMFEDDIGKNVIAAAEASNSTLDERVLSFERRLLEQALTENAGRLQPTAASLGVTRRSLKSRLRDHDINPRNYRN